jgi:hypothetical protein
MSGITANTFLGDFLQTWDETNHSWSEIIEPSTALSTKTGYALWGTPAKAATYTFSGTPLTGEQTQAITFTEYSSQSDAYEGANLLGNPYPSSIDWEQVSGYGAVYYFDGSAYVAWPEGTGSYGTGSRYIAPMQGFFIVTSASGNFTLNNSMRTHDGATNYYKSDAMLNNGIELYASNGDYNDLLVIRFDENRSDQFDTSSDAWKFPSGTEGLSELWSVCEDGNLCIDVRPETETIQLGFANDQAGFYSIGIHDIADITTATLEDTKTGTFNDLTKSAYEFAWEVTDDETRFKLHLNAVSIDETPISESNILIYAANQQIFIKGGGSGEVTVSDLMGRIMLRQEITSEEKMSLPLNLKSGIYLVTVQSGKEMKTGKVFFK